ncbi:MAG: prepilin-type N-terminal cleavage/methylation domain-containing protein, partial [Candidatus Abyssobacteria bacterium SURF_5]
MKRQGYTLVEMLVVLAIIALMMVIVVPRFAVSQKGEGLKGAANELGSMLRTARRIAITKRQVRALALDIYSIPAEFMIMRWDEDPDPTKSTWIQDEGTETHRFTDENVAVVAVTTRNWGGGSSLDITRTDDMNPFDGAEELCTGTPPYFDSNERLFNPQINASGAPAYGNSHVNVVYHLIKFQPTGTADEALIYLWNIEENRREIPTAEYA